MHAVTSKTERSVNLPLGRVIGELGAVIGTEDECITVLTEHGKVKARRATSCLVKPERDDQAMVVQVSDGSYYVAAILERPAGTKPSIHVEGDLALQAPRGRITMAARDGLDFVSANELSMGATQVSIRAAEGKIFMDRLSFLGSQVLSHVDRIKLVAQSVDSVIDRISERVKRMYRTVEDMDVLRSRMIDHRADATMTLRGKNTMVTAEELVRIDGDQIHLG